MRFSRRRVVVGGQRVDVGAPGSAFAFSFSSAFSRGGDDDGPAALRGFIATVRWGMSEPSSRAGVHERLEGAARSAGRTRSAAEG